MLKLNVKRRKTYVKKKLKNSLIYQNRITKFVKTNNNIF